jgi:tetratricopeptide (TPR) repeat protein
MVPNVAWDYAYAASKRQDQSPIDAAREWIERNAPADAVFASWRKEMAFWTNDRKMVRLQIVMPFHDFDAMLRDHDVRYVISLVDQSGLRDMEPQMVASRLRSFRTVFRIGNIEIAEVGERKAFRDGEGEESLLESERVRRAVFRAGLRLLFDGRSEGAEQHLALLLQDEYRNAIVQFYHAVALGFSGNPDAARALFDRLKQLSQTSLMIGQLHFHEQLLDKRERLATVADSRSRASWCLGVAHDYWGIGFRKEALKFIRLSLEADSAFFPALEAASYFFLTDGDTVMAKKAFDRLSRLEMKSLLLPALEQVFTAIERLRREVHPRHRAGLRLSLADAYLQYGMRQEAINEYRFGLEEDPRNTRLLESLANLYLADKRNGPAFNYLMQLVEVNPSHRRAVEQLEALQERM